MCAQCHPFPLSWSPLSPLMVTLLPTHGHPSPHSWSPFSPLIVTLLYSHGHPSIHSWLPFYTLMVTLLSTHGHPSLHSWSPFSPLMVTPLPTHGHPSLHSWLPFSALMFGIMSRGECPFKCGVNAYVCFHILAQGFDICVVRLCGHHVCHLVGSSGSSSLGKIMSNHLYKLCSLDVIIRYILYQNKFGSTHYLNDRTTLQVRRSALC